jgi:hypothetical protein
LTYSFGTPNREHPCFFSRLRSKLKLWRFEAITIPDSQSFYFLFVSRQLDVFMSNRQRKDKHTLAKLRNVNRRISKMALVVEEERIERGAIQMDLFNGRVALAKACHSQELFRSVRCSFYDYQGFTS